MCTLGRNGTVAWRMEHPATMAVPRPPRTVSAPEQPNEVSCEAGLAGDTPTSSLLGRTAMTREAQSATPRRAAGVVGRRSVLLSTSRALGWGPIHYLLLPRSPAPEPRAGCAGSVRPMMKGAPSWGSRVSPPSAPVGVCGLWPTGRGRSRKVGSLVPCRGTGKLK